MVAAVQQAMNDCSITETNIQKVYLDGGCTFAESPRIPGTVPPGQVHFRFFDVMVDPQSRRYLSEDYGFCRLWEALGGEIYVDANSNLSHAGERLYRGDFGATLRAFSAHAIGAPKGQTIRVHGLENLKPNP